MDLLLVESGYYQVGAFSLIVKTDCETDGSSAALLFSRHLLWSRVLFIFSRPHHRGAVSSDAAAGRQNIRGRVEKYLIYALPRPGKSAGEVWPAPIFWEQSRGQPQHGHRLTGHQNDSLFTIRILKSDDLCLTS